MALTLGLMLSCGKKDEEPPAEDTESATVCGKVQKGPYVQGTEITVPELDSSMTLPQVIPSQAPSMTIQEVSASKENLPIK